MVNWEEYEDGEETTMTPGKGEGGFQTRPYGGEAGSVVIANWGNTRMTGGGAVMVNWEEYEDDEDESYEPEDESR